jgi:hypothetical protein
LIDFSTALLQILFGIILLSLYHPFFIFFGALLLIVLYAIFKFSYNSGLTSSLKESKYKYKVAGWLQEIARNNYSFRKQEYADGDIIHIDLAQEVSFLNKAAIKSTLNDIPENSEVIINAQDTVYIAHDVLDLIKEFKKIRAKEENIKVKLIGFKKAYDLLNTGEEGKHIFVEHK